MRMLILGANPLGTCCRTFYRATAHVSASSSMVEWLHRTPYCFPTIVFYYSRQMYACSNGSSVELGSKKGTPGSPQNEAKPSPSVKSKEDMATCIVQRNTTLGGVEWIDICGVPKVTQRNFRDRLKTELRKFDIHPSIIKNIMNPTSLPHCSFSHGDVVLLSLRYINIDTAPKGPSIGELSQSLSMLITKSRIITVRRFDIGSLRAMQRQWEERYREACHAHVVNAIFQRLVLTYEPAAKDCFLMFDRYEVALLKMMRHERSSFSRQVYELKRRASVYARLLTNTHSTYITYTRHYEIPSTDLYAQEIEKTIRDISATAEEVDQNATALLQLNFQLSANDLNNLMMILTIFSVLFVPIDFVAAFFGMNFVHLPFSEETYGPLAALCMMIGLSMLSMFCIRKIGFL